MGSCSSTGFLLKGLAQRQSVRMKSWMCVFCPRLRVMTTRTACRSRFCTFYGLPFVEHPFVSCVRCISAQPWTMAPPPILMSSMPHRYQVISRDPSTLNARHVRVVTADVCQRADPADTCPHSSGCHSSTPMKRGPWCVVKRCAVVCVEDERSGGGGGGGGGGCHYTCVVCLTTTTTLWCSFGRQQVCVQRPPDLVPLAPWS